MHNAFFFCLHFSVADANELCINKIYLGASRVTPGIFFLLTQIVRYVVWLPSRDPKDLSTPIRIET